MHLGNPKTLIYHLAQAMRSLFYLSHLSLQLHVSQQLLGTQKRREAMHLCGRMVS